MCSAHQLRIIYLIKNAKLAIHSVSNYKLFDIFDIKFTYFILKICAKYHFFCYGLLYQYKFFKMI